ncbi:multicopper oxidase domain-containing protein [Arenimonas daejeonensis]|uniref:multicopper oxidase domain-containing protein n=1 Tax=Arenimonas daejeonensis TaxID=370777 RepID=UPI001D157742|nr:multicopper oxidase domain-containing protein [Arenimonas daejeonensis]
MKVHLLALSIAALLALPGCRENPNAGLDDRGKSATAAASDTGGSRKGDFGPPQGEMINAVLTSPPNVPPATGRDYPAKVKVELEVREVDLEISEGVTYTFWTFGGTVPGSFIRVRQGDTVEFHLHNHPDSKMPHNIDLHGVTGPGGGAASTFTAPGHGSQFTFKALNAGLYVYHCATAPVGMHVANGMYGLILVEPPEGLPEVDKEFYVMQGDFYTTTKYREKGYAPFDMQRAIDENATYVLFNGAENSLTGDKALKANVNETVRMYVGNGGPNLISSFHVIGEIFDKVWYEGGTHYWGERADHADSCRRCRDRRVPHRSARQLRAGGPLAVPRVQQGRAGDPESGRSGGSDDLHRQGSRPHLCQGRQGREHGPGGRGRRRRAGRHLEPGRPDQGRRCAVRRHLLNLPPARRQGPGRRLPPLAQSDYLAKGNAELIKVVLNGLTGPVTVNGQDYNSVMPPMSQLTDDEVANILTYTLNSWGNPGGRVTKDEVAKIRAGTERSEGAAH